MHYTNPQTDQLMTQTGTVAQSITLGSLSAFGRKRQFDQPSVARPEVENLVDRAPTLPPVQPSDLTPGGVDARS